MYGTAEDAYDFVDQMAIGDLTAFASGLDNGEVAGLLQQLQEVSTAYVDFSRSDYWFSIELPQVFQPQSIRATWETAFSRCSMYPVGSMA